MGIGDERSSPVPRRICKRRSQGCLRIAYEDERLLILQRGDQCLWSHQARFAERAERAIRSQVKELDIHFAAQGITTGADRPAHASAIGQSLEGADAQSRFGERLREPCDRRNTHAHACERSGTDRDGKERNLFESKPGATEEEIHILVERLRVRSRTPAPQDGQQFRPPLKGDASALRRRVHSQNQRRFRSADRPCRLSVRIAHLTRSTAELYILHPYGDNASARGANRARHLRSARTPQGSRMSSGSLTPMLKQYHEIKRRYPGTLLFFRLGDFYELFYEDAIIGARELDITLTARHKERGAPVPMCGVPHHAVMGYIAKLIRKGYRVALCDQVEEPKSSTKLVRREVVRIITPGTVLEGQLLEASQNNYLAAICGTGEAAAASFLDVSTGEFVVTEFVGERAWEQLLEQMEAFAPREVVYPKSLESLLAVYVRRETAPSEEGVDRERPLEPTVFDRTARTPLDDWVFDVAHAHSLLCEHFGVSTLEGFDLAGHDLAVQAAGAALHYVRETQRAHAAHISGISFFRPSEFMILDPTTVRNLELVEALDGSREHTLFAVLNATATAMGARLLRQWILRPCCRRAEIVARLDAVEDLVRRTVLRDQVRAHLKRIQDLERLLARVTMGTATPRDLAAVRHSLAVVPEIKEMLGEATASLLEALRESLDELSDLRALLEAALVENPPATLGEGPTIREGFHAELDEVRALVADGKSYIARLEHRERARTGIPSLKVKFNQVFGYFIEVSKANLHLVPPDYERKQTLVGAERFTTRELKEYEAKVLGAEERILELERELFHGLREEVARATRRLQATARALAYLDVVAALAETAVRRHYRRPVVTEGDELIIRAGRHPVVEVQLGRFVPNDLYMNNTTDRILIITGPNMGGKSVYLRQAALICIMAQIGSFVPAEEARLGLVDRIFTRVGSSDSVAGGRSTFMVEMIETAKILNTATPRSLILLDEVGRGTATFDGLSIAWAVAEYLHNNANHAAKTLFATHYHELTELARVLPGVRNYQVLVKESRGEILFLHKVVEGSANKSYGIEVARLAGLPPSVIARAREILENLEANELDPMGRPRLAEHLPSREGWKRQPSLFEAAHRSLLEQLRALDVDRLSPEEAKRWLQEAKKKLL